MIKAFALVVMLLSGSSSAQAIIIDLGYDGLVFGYGYSGAPAGRAYAVRFTPPGGVVQIVSVSVKVWPHDPGCSANKLWILDNDGSALTPGSTLFGPVQITTPPTQGWVTVDLTATHLSIEGDFYVAYLSESPINTCGSVMHNIGLPGTRFWTYSNGRWIWAGETSILYSIHASVETDPVPVRLATWGSIKLYP